jgi:hypothetical protein
MYLCTRAYRQQSSLAAGRSGVWLIMIESKQKSPRRGRLGRPGLVQWAELAERVRKDLADRGIAEPTQNDLKQAAKTNGLKATTLARHVKAFDFVESLRQKPGSSQVAAGLRDAAVAGVELIMRWEKYDSTAAMVAARQLISGEYTVDALRSAERKAHATTDKVVSLRSYRHQLRERLTSWLIEQLGSDFERQSVSPSDPAVDLLFADKSNPPRRAGALILDPFPSRHRGTKKSEFLTLLVGASVMLHEAIGFVPDGVSVDAEQYQWWLESNYAFRPNISLYKIPAGTYRDLEPRFIAGGGPLSLF